MSKSNGIVYRAKILLDTIERYEKYKIVSMKELHRRIQNPQFFTFSCVKGGEKRRELNTGLGDLFKGKKFKETQKFISELKTGLTVFIDDTEPSQVWGWGMDQSEVTAWYEMVIADNSRQIPKNWEVVLWSSVDPNTPDPMGNYHPEAMERLRQYLCQFHEPKKARELAISICRHTMHQEQVLTEKFPNGILVQATTPWVVKDPIMGQSKTGLPIIHPLDGGGRK